MEQNRTERSPHQQKTSDHIKENQLTDLTAQLQCLRQEANHFKRSYFEMQSINRSIIAAIKSVYSQQVGEELEKIVQQEQTNFTHSRTNINPTDLTHTFCEKLKTYGSKLISEQSIDQLPFRQAVPTKLDDSIDESLMSNRKNSRRSPFLSQSNNKKSLISQSPFKKDRYEDSTRRSYTPVKAHIATEIYCQLCEKVFPPNEFVSHAQKCKYEVQYVQTENFSTSLDEQSKAISLNYQKMMRNLFKIREQIQQQIQLIMHSKEEIDRANLKKKLEKDLKKVIKVINQKEEQIRRKKHCSGKNSYAKQGSKKSSKVR